MIFRRIAVTVLMLSAIGGLFAHPARAEPETVPVVPDFMTVELVRNEAGGASIRVSAQTVINGCLNIAPMEYKRQYNANYLDLAFAGYKMTFPEDRGPACNNGLQYPRVDIPVSIGSLKSNNVEGIRFIMGSGGKMDIYNLDIWNDTISITPRTQNFFKLGKPHRGTIAPTTVVIYPRGTLILSAPTVPAESRRNEVENYAFTNKLLPLTDRLPDFEPPPGEEGRYYYVDESGAIAAQVQSYNNINLTDTVYARRPGAYE